MLSRKLMFTILLSGSLTHWCWTVHVRFATHLLDAGNTFASTATEQSEQHQSSCTRALGSLEDRHTRIDICMLRRGTQVSQLKHCRSTVRLIGALT